MKRFLEYGIPDEFRKHLPYVESLMTSASDLELEGLENAIYVAKMRRMARRLNSAGFHATIDKTFPDGSQVQFNLILVSPSEKHPGEWATLDECKRLLDIVANLPRVAAFKRWRAKIEPLASDTYTRQDAARDTLEARERLRQRFEAGEMSAVDYALEYRTTSFMDLAPRGKS